jgi:hypothetical protein
LGPARDGFAVANDAAQAVRIARLELAHRLADDARVWRDGDLGDSSNCARREISEILEHRRAAGIWTLRHMVEDHEVRESMRGAG